jgi:hypothetical protein
MWAFALAAQQLSIFARKKAGAPAIAAKFPIRGHKAVMLYVDAA